MPSFLKRLIDWFLGKAAPKLETLEEETIVGSHVTLIRYRRKTLRAYRTWRAIYKGLDYDLVFGWETLAYLPGVPRIKKRNRMSTHLVNIYKQGLHARYNPIRGVHEPDVEVLLKDQEVCLEADYMTAIVQRWKAKTRDHPSPIMTTDDVVNLIIDQVVKHLLRHSPSEIQPTAIDWKTVIEDRTRKVLGNTNHEVFPDVAIVTESDEWVG